MECTVATEENTVYITLPDAFTFGSRDGFRQAINANKSAINCVVDFQKVERMDSAGLGMLLLLKGSSKGASQVVLKNVRPEILKVLQIANFQKMFQIDSSESSE